MMLRSDQPRLFDLATLLISSMIFAAAWPSLGHALGGGSGEIGNPGQYRPAKPGEKAGQKTGQVPQYAYPVYSASEINEGESISATIVIRYPLQGAEISECQGLLTSPGLASRPGFDSCVATRVNAQ